MNRLTPYLMSILSVGMSLTAFAQSDELADLHREVNIFEKVISGALKHDTNKQVKAVNGYYLHNQGVVFELSLRSRSLSDWRAHLEDMRDIHAFSEIQAPDFGQLEGQLAQLGEDVTQVSKEAYRAALDAIRQSAEKVREVAEEERDTRRRLQMLESQKQMMRLEQAEAKKEQEIDQEIARLLERKQDLEKSKEAFKAKLKLEKKRKQQQQVQQQVELKKRIAQSLARSLCDYGNGLRSISNDEYISFKYQLRHSDKHSLTVFKKQDVNQCITGSIKASKLQILATQYQF